MAQHGLEWVGTGFGLEPRWTVEPDMRAIKSIARKHLEIPQAAPCNVCFYTQGAFNKLYKISTETCTYLMRVTLPVEPRNKTNSEVGTINFISTRTSIPVAKIYAFDDSQESELGFEWILMEMLPGRTLKDSWRKMSWDAKEFLVREVASHQAQLWKHKLRGIGNVYQPSDEDSNLKDIAPDIESEDQDQAETVQLEGLPTPGPIVSLQFFWGGSSAVDPGIPHGPFSTPSAWLHARLQLDLTTQAKILATSTDEDDLEDAQDITSLAERLLQLLPLIFPPSHSLSGEEDESGGELEEQKEEEKEVAKEEEQVVEKLVEKMVEKVVEEEYDGETILFHDDLHMSNILVDEQGKVTGVADWECVSTVPLWRACQIPEFLKSKTRSDEPLKENYSKEEEEEDLDEDEEPILENEGINSLYWIHLLEYELTRLRDVFVEEMRRLEPSWMEVWEGKGSKFRADFEAAVGNCANGWRMRKIREWVDEVERRVAEGEEVEVEGVYSLRDRFYE